MTGTPEGPQGAAPEPGFATVSAPVAGPRGPLRRGLDARDLLSGALSGLFLVGIAATIVAQVVARQLGGTIDSTETAGFCLAASTFLGLAYAFRRGAHIRVTLLIGRTGAGPRRWLELWCVGFSILAVAYFLWWAVDLVWFSWAFDEISPGLMAIPLWIPRSAMALGAAVFLIALVDEFVSILRGVEPSYEANAEHVLEGGE